MFKSQCPLKPTLQNTFLLQEHRQKVIMQSILIFSVFLHVWWVLCSLIFKIQSFRDGKHLIMARDVDRLSYIFQGWLPFIVGWILGSHVLTHQVCSGLELSTSHLLPQNLSPHINMDPFVFPHVCNVARCNPPLINTTWLVALVRH